VTVRYLPGQRGYRQTVEFDLKWAELPAPTQLNYDGTYKPFSIARPRVNGLNFMAGLSQWGMQQWFHQAYLPPAAYVGPIQKIRNVGGVYGAGTISQSTVHIPSVLVPPSVG
jgi:hypothetical protein